MGQRLCERSGSIGSGRKLEILPNWAPNTQLSLLFVVGSVWVEDIILAKCHQWNITLLF